VKTKTSTAVDKLSKLSLLGTTALIASFGMMPMAYAQDADTAAVEDDGDVVVATGIRQSLKEARDLKRDADTAIDSITASDVGTLPDLSVAEALARVPGVVVQRFDVSDNNAGDFPSPEGGGNLIRGLTLVRSEFNGRDTFSANGGRSLDFGTIPPELIGAVDVYKNTTADQIEGGIGGSINLRTLEPFDKEGMIAVLNADITYTDLRDEVSPDYSVILGNRWDTGAGEFGLLGSFSSSELKSELHGFQIGQVVPFQTGGQTIGLPGGFQLRTNEVDRGRDSYYIAGQWRDKSGDLLVTAKYSLIENDVDSDERTLEFFPDGESWNQFEVSGLTTSPFSSPGLPQCQGGNDPTPANPTCEMTQAATALYESGVISNNLRDWTGAAGAPFTNLGIHQVDKSKTDDLSLNIKWRPSEQLYIQLDGHMTNAEFSRDRLWGGTRFFSDFELNADLDDPYVVLQPNVANNPNRREGGGAPTTGGLADQSNANLLFTADEFAENDGEMYAIRGDVEYEFANDGWFDAVKFGARYADREQVNRSAGLNWAAVAPPWAGGGYLPYSEFDGGNVGEVVDFAGFQRGGVVRGSNTSVVFANRELLQNYDDWVGALAGESSIPQGTRNNGEGCDDSPQYGDWSPLRVGGSVDYACRGGIGDVREEVTNLYGRLDFGNEFENGMSLEGNIGVRYTSVDVSGVVGNNFIDVANGNAPGQNPIDFSPEAVAYLAQADTSEAGVDLSSDDRFLPSLNVKWNLNDKTLIRFAASEAITRPRIDQLRADRTTVGQFRFITSDDLTLPVDQRIEDIQLNQINVYGGNPDLKPIESTNLDLSFEHYYGDNNSLTLSLFSKDVRNNIFYGSKTIDTVNLDGREVAIVFNGDINQDEAKIKGLELAYQQFYDKLPGVLGNLGIQANYTYIDASTNAPVPIVDADGDGVPDSFEQILRFGVNNYLGLSEHAANLIGIYQDDNLEMRLAYNWRSEYLSSYRDFVTGNPIFQTDRGYLDGSVKYDFNDNFQVRFQIANILDTKAQSEQQIDASGQRFGRTSFVGDRRIRIGARYAF
jgi:iron complex outermembrane receptor protein